MSPIPALPVLVCLQMLALAGPSPAADGPAPPNVRAAAGVDYPRKPVRLMVPFSAGGGSDIVARVLAQKLNAAWEQSVVVDNRGGGGSTIGTNIVAKAPADGYTILLTSISVAYLPALYAKLPYDTERELDPVVLAVTQPNLLAVSIGTPVKSVGELIAIARSRPGTLRYGSAGSGSAAHLATELFRSKAKINIVHVPYKGGGPALPALMSGELQVLILGMATLLPQVKAERVRALAVTSAERARAAPDIPTIAEAGLPGAEYETWYGIFVPAGTARATAAKINLTFNQALAMADVRERLMSSGFETLGGSREKFADFLKSEMKKWAAVVAESGIQVD